MQDIYSYILLSREWRRAHLRLSEPCSEIGGGSQQFRALLAYQVRTTIPSSTKIYLCHACGNAKCSNVLHLYWGTPSDNVIDAIEHGTLKSPYEYTLNKYSADEMKVFAKKRGKSLSDGKKLNLSLTEIEKRLKDIQESTKERGWIKTMSIKMGYFSHSSETIYSEIPNTTQSVMQRLLELRTRIETAWSIETTWSPDEYEEKDPAWGQCGVTAIFLFHQGYRIISSTAIMPNGSETRHFWNVSVSQAPRDYTWRQFPVGTVLKDHFEILTPSEILENSWFEDRYQNFLANLREVKCTS